MQRKIPIPNGYVVIPGVGVFHIHSTLKNSDCFPAEAVAACRIAYEAIRRANDQNFSSSSEELKKTVRE